MNKDTKETPNPSIAMGCFFLITTAYFLSRTYLPKFSPKISISIYFCLLIVGESIINVGLTKTLCGSEQYPTAILATLIPWVVIFGTMNVLLEMFPGWLRPFSNTFGYLLTKGSVSKTMNEILKGENESDSKTLSSELKDVQKTLATIYNDQSLLVNEITTENFETFWKKMKPLFKVNVDDVLKKKLLGHINTKESIAKYIWYLLTGWLVTSASYNYIVNAGCTQTVEQQTESSENYNKDLEKKLLTAAAEKPREYKTYE
tara:strand:+ start:6366 stop:7145 length:780 start_codon:yes stop_codon:yes gene_type:complete